MRISVLLILIFFLFASCESDTITGYQVDAFYRIWKNQNIHNYTIDQVKSCFCADAGLSVRITVRSDTIYSVMRLSDNTIIAKSNYLSVDSLFGVIKYGTADSIEVKYNTQYGYPEYLDIDPQNHPVDGGVLYETSNLKQQ